MSALCLGGITTTSEHKNPLPCKCKHNPISLIDIVISIEIIVSIYIVITIAVNHVLQYYNENTMAFDLVNYKSTFSENYYCFKNYLNYYYNFDLDARKNLIYYLSIFKNLNYLEASRYPGSTA